MINKYETVKFNIDLNDLAKNNLVDADGDISYIFKTKIKNINIWLGITNKNCYIENGLTADCEPINTNIAEYLLPKKEYKKYCYVYNNIYNK